MDISQTAATAIAQIVPILLLASYFDRDVLGKVGQSNTRTRAYWVSSIALILVGEMIAVMGAVKGDLHGWSGYAVMLAVVLCLTNLFSIAMWRMFGLDLVSGLPTKPSRKLRRLVKRRK
jgi:hypothetical protein